jgi:hypothetical protein
MNDRERQHKNNGIHPFRDHRKGSVSLGPRMMCLSYFVSRFCRGPWFNYVLEAKDCLHRLLFPPASRRHGQSRVSGLRSSSFSMRTPRLPRWPLLRGRRLTLFGRAIALIGIELLANAACWVAAALSLGQADGLLGLALLAWVSKCDVSYAGDGADILHADYWLTPWWAPTAHAATRCDISGGTDLLR